jgi:hypothetical protein
VCVNSSLFAYLDIFLIIPILGIFSGFTRLHQFCLKGKPYPPP